MTKKKKINTETTTYYEEWTSERKTDRPHEINSEIDFELNEEINELSQICSISMWIEKCEPRVWVSQVESCDFVSASRLHHSNVDGWVSGGGKSGGGGSGDGGEFTIGVFGKVVGGRRRREKGKLGGEVREHAPHLFAAENTKLCAYQSTVRERNMWGERWKHGVQRDWNKKTTRGRWRRSKREKERNGLNMKENSGRGRDVCERERVRVNVRFLGNWLVLCLTVSSSFLFLLFVSLFINSRYIFSQYNFSIWFNFLLPIC